jgi:hypothetical protein
LPIEVANGFGAPRRFERAQRLGLAVGEAIGRGPLVVLALLGPLAGGAQIDQVSHPGLDGNWIRGDSLTYSRQMRRYDVEAYGWFGVFPMSPHVNLRPAPPLPQYTVS